MEDVAAGAGVSRSLVSLVMRGSPKVSEERRARVLEVAEELGYRPNVLARNLASARSGTIGITINDLHNPFFADVAVGLEQYLSEAGVSLLLNSGWRHEAGEHAAIEKFMDFRVDGIILAGTRLDSELIVNAASFIPIVAVGRDLSSDQIDTVNNDEFAGARLVVEHLVENGHQRICHLTGGTGAGAPQRRLGYEQAMRDCGLEDSISCIDGDFTEESGAEAAHKALQLDPAPTAIFASNDLMAIGALGVIEAAGLRAPQDISLVGYDNTMLASIRHISLSTVNQPRTEMGRLAGELLLERIEGRTDARHEILPPELRLRSTSGPVAN